MENLPAGLGFAPTLLTQKFLPPAGCGKTALLASWLTELPPGRWSWLSLDKRDNDPVRMWSHFIEALRGLAVGVGERSLNELLRSGGRSAADRWMDWLLNDLAAVARPTSYLIVDDLHSIEEPEIRAGFTLFVANMPPWLRLVISTRADPPLPLPRLRAEGRLIEIRQRDLRFEPDEADQLLRADGIEDLDTDRLAWLMTRTEGWAAGLQLAAIDEWFRYHTLFAEAVQSEARIAPHPSLGDPRSPHLVPSASR